MNGLWGTGAALRPNFPTCCAFSLANSPHRCQKLDDHCAKGWRKWSRHCSGPLCTHSIAWRAWPAGRCSPLEMDVSGLVLMVPAYSIITAPQWGMSLRENACHVPLLAARWCWCCGCSTARDCQRRQATDLHSATDSPGVFYIVSCLHTQFYELHSFPFFCWHWTEIFLFCDESLKCSWFVYASKLINLWSLKCIYYHYYK